ncbi:hypothetical protein E2C01_058913 [Portunus trituberculatus]|uniref:Uncharacterized protein n=1 Tax=Portunus trituberculatus TaxID=210409 RepID=A0A5B7H142_PORTR|nr:hypothetical protein [Portunus trituberculatus]
MGERLCVGRAEDQRGCARPHWRRRPEIMEGEGSKGEGVLHLLYRRARPSSHERRISPAQEARSEQPTMKSELLGFTYRGAL